MPSSNKCQGTNQVRNVATCHLESSLGLGYDASTSEQVELMINREVGRDEGSSWLVYLVVRLAINAAALWVAARFIPGINIEGLTAYVGTTAIFGVVNAIVKPLAQLLGCPLTCLTVGLFLLMINAAMLVLTAWIAGRFDLNMHIDGFWAAFWGALLIAVVSGLLTGVLGRSAKRPGSDD
jgi:putative membrane protein